MKDSTSRPYGSGRNVEGVGSSDTYHYDVFLSCSSLDNEATGGEFGIASTLNRSLIAAGLGVFFNLYEPPPDTAAAKRAHALYDRLSGTPERRDKHSGRVGGWLTGAFERSCHCIALTSKMYDGSPWCQLERAGFGNVHRQDPERLFFDIPIGECLDEYVEKWWTAQLRTEEPPEKPKRLKRWSPAELSDARAAIDSSSLRRDHPRDESVRAFARLPILELYAREPTTPTRRRGGMAGATPAVSVRYRCPGWSSPFPFKSPYPLDPLLERVEAVALPHPDYERYERIVRGFMAESETRSQSGALRALVAEASRTRPHRALAATRAWLGDVTDTASHVRAAFRGEISGEPNPTVESWLSQAQTDAKELRRNGVPTFAAPDDET